MESFFFFPFGSTFLRSLAAAAGLGAFLILELFFPARPSVDSKARRFLTNLGIILLDGAILVVLYGDFFPRLCRFVAVHRIGVLNLIEVEPAGRFFSTVVLLDGATYLWHVANHASPLLWRFHRVHHSDPDLDVTTAFRFHWGEILASSFWKIGIVILFGLSWPALFVFEVLLLLGAQFQHSNLRLPALADRALRLILVTPAMHRIHHSGLREESDSNYATLFSGWDRILGTYRCASPEGGIGLPEFPRPIDLTFLRLLFLPIERNPRGPRRGRVPL